jgi:Peptidase_C39 like family
VLDSEMPLNSAQLLTTPGDPKTNLMGRISALGCFMTSATMVLNYFASALVANPRQTNDWLNDQPAGFVGSSNVNSYELARFARSKGVQMRYAGGSDQNNDADIEAYLCSGNPVMLKVAACARRDPIGCGHFVVATGKTVSTARNELVWTINDPAFDCADLGSNAARCYYGGTYWGYRKWVGPNGGPASKSRVHAAGEDESALVITGTPSVLLTVTDPSGALVQCGLGVAVPGPGIPNASCTTESMSDDDDADAGETTLPTTVFEVSQPAAGTYQVVALATDPGGYTIAAAAYDTGGNVSRARIDAVGPATTPGAFTVTYSPAADAGVVMTGPPAVADAGSDAGAADSGTGDDAGGSANDAGGSPNDAGGSVNDAGGSVNDAGDGGSTPSPPAGKGGCGSPGAGLATLIGLLALRRPRRPTSMPPATSRSDSSSRSRS